MGLHLLGEASAPKIGSTKTDREISCKATRLRQLGLGRERARARRRSRCLLTLAVEANDEVNVFDPVLKRGRSIARCKYRNSVHRHKTAPVGPGHARTAPERQLMPIPTPVLHPPFHIVRLNHVALTVTDLAAARAFWVDTLGLQVTDETA